MTKIILCGEVTPTDYLVRSSERPLDSLLAEHLLLPG